MSLFRECYLLLRLGQLQVCLSALDRMRLSIAHDTDKALQTRDRLWSEYRCIRHKPVQTIPLWLRRKA